MRISIFSSRHLFPLTPSEGLSDFVIVYGSNRLGRQTSGPCPAAKFFDGRRGLRIGNLLRDVTVPSL